MASDTVEIEYCTQCRWLLRAAWMAQELLTTFESELGGVLLKPGTGGIFEVRLNGETLYSRKAEGRFPESKQRTQAADTRPYRSRKAAGPQRPLTFISFTYFYIPA